MARRSRDEAEETKENIVAAAIKLFLREGVSQTTLEKIAAEAGYTRGAVYHHFENKAELLKELMHRSHPPAMKMFDSLKLEQSQHPLQTLEAEISDGIELLLSNKESRDIHTIFIFNCEFVEKTNPSFEPECKFAQAVLDKVCTYLDKAKALGHLSPDADTRKLSTLLMAVCSGLISLSLRNVMLEKDVVDVRTGVHIFFRGLRAEAACH